MPCLAYGTGSDRERAVRESKRRDGTTWSESEKEAHEAHSKRTSQCLKHAICNAGCRHIDTAFAYGTEFEINAVLSQLFNNDKKIDGRVLKREDVFITTKFPPMFLVYVHTC